MGMRAFNPWLSMLGMGGGPAEAQAKPQAFPGRQPAPAPQAPAADPYANWQPAPADVGATDFMGPPQSAAGASNLPPTSEELAASQAMIEQQAGQPGPAVTPNSPGGPSPGGAGGPTAIPASKISDMIAQLNKRELQSLEQQGLSVASLKKKLGQLEGTELPVDLTPWVALTDSFTGSNFSQTYKPTETLQTRRAATDKLQGQILQAEQGMTENEIAMLKSGLASEFQLEGNDYKKSQDAIQNKFKAQEIANDRAKIAAAAGKGDGMGPMDVWKMSTDIEKLDTTKKVMGSIDLAKALNTYEQAVNKYGISPVGEGSAVLDNAYSAITLAYKNAGELGALSGPDMNIVKAGVGPAGDVGTWLKSGIKGGDAGIKEQIRAMRSATKGGYDSRMQNLRAATAPFQKVVGHVVDNYQNQMNEAMGQAPVDKKAAAIAWATANPKDPRAAKILEHASGGK